MAWSLLGREDRQTLETASQTQAMRHHDTLFHSLLQVIPRARFERLVAQHRGTYQDRRLSFWSQFLALLYAQFAGLQSLRDLVAALASQHHLLAPLGLDRVCRSTLADANRDRPASLLSAVFDQLLDQLNRSWAGQAREVVRLIDSTSISLNTTLFGWAYRRGGKAGAKLHLVYDPHARCPTQFVITPARVNDITPAKRMAIVPGATYVFDLGYYDYGWWARLDAAECCIVSRLKKNTPLTLVSERAVPAGSTILSDRTGYLPARQAASRKNPFDKLVREIRVKTDSGKVLRIVSNDLEASAEEIAGLYKLRWQIELLFKWLKQNLRIKRFLGTSETAVKLQIIAALIAYVLVRLAQQAWAMAASMQQLARLIRANLLHRTSLPALRGPPPRRQASAPQPVPETAYA